MKFNLLRNNTGKFFYIYLITLWLSLINVSILLSGCGNHNENIPDISKINIELQSFRFDKDFYSIDTNHIAAGLQKLAVKYPDFLNYYLDTLMDYKIHGNFSDTNKAISDSLRPFMTYKDFINLQDTIVKYYPDNKETDEALISGFRYLKYYFPEIKLPKIIYLDMELRYFPVFPLDRNTICIGLDWFLGDQFKYYGSVGVPGYMAAHLRKSYLPVSVFSTLFLADHPFIMENKTLLDMMIARGKEQYFLHKVLPLTADTVLFGFTKRQLDWCTANESLIYNFFIHQNLLYNKDIHSTEQFVHDGPYAQGLESVSEPVKSSPGNIGTWLGYRIVCNFMANHPEMNLAQLTKSDFEGSKFLDQAKYRPR